MPVLSDPADFQCGIYVFVFESQNVARRFIRRYQHCPNWPVMTYGAAPEEVVVIALEPIAQCHGDFSAAHNTLVAQPGYIGATEVRFHRDDALIALFPQHQLRMGWAGTAPCGSDCTGCPSYRAPCRGCPATHRTFAAP